MANDEHVAMLKKGVADWNKWREENRNILPDLREADLAKANLSKATLYGADLAKANLSEANLFEANLYEANLSDANLFEANLGRAYLNKVNLFYANLCRADLTGASLPGVNLGGANLTGAKAGEASLYSVNLKGANLTGGAVLTGADLSEADLSGANLSGAKLSGANLSRANLWCVNLSGADLSGANLFCAVLVMTDLTGADLTGCRVYGVSAWRLKLDGTTKQQSLVINYVDEPTITVDNIEVAQFIYLMLNNQKIRDVIDSITSKAVLILGRFTDERKAVLDALREELRKRDYLPILFDFSVPATRGITETVSLLARMARFVVADITDPKSIPQELATIVPDLPSVPVQPLLLEGSAEYGMFEHFKRYPWVLETYRYPSSEHLIACLGEHVIGPPENYARSVRK
jgi:uncharacterized protein YjbI with pentapeptide repeats